MATATRRDARAPTFLARGSMTPLRVRTHEAVGLPVAVLHGGPGAPGSAWGLASGLGPGFRVVEPFQRGSGGEPLTVARHVEDLLDLLAEWFPAERPALVGHSWGAMLALAAVAERPEAAAAVALVGSGTWDVATREEFRARLEARTTPSQRAALDALDGASIPDDERLERRAAICEARYAVDLLPAAPGAAAAEPVDAGSNRETWHDLLAQQAGGVYPARLARVRCPVLLLHGAEDPHPGPAIGAGLLVHLPQLEYREFPRCGHEPWRERHAREPFFEDLRRWLRAALR